MENIEHIFLDGVSFDNTIFLVASGLSCLTILTANGYLLHFIIKQPTKTFLDWMMVFDSILCIRKVFKNALEISWKSFFSISHFSSRIHHFTATSKVRNSLPELKMNSNVI